MRITTVILTRDSEPTVARAVESARAVSDEVLVLDTGSSDATERLARRACPDLRWVERPWADSFSAARNAAFEEVPEGLLMFLDSDEWIAPEDRGAAREALRGVPPEHDAAWSPVVRDELTSHEAHHLPRIVWAEGPLRFRYRVHERLAEGEREAWPEDLPILLRHDGYSPEHLRRFGKRERNLRLLDLDLREHPGDPHPLFFALRDGCAERAPEENRELLRRLDEATSDDAARPRRFDLLGRKVLLSHEWTTRGAHPDTLALAEEVLERAPGDPDAVYVTVAAEVLGARARLGARLREVAGARRAVGEDVLTWGMTPRADHLDALLLELMRTLGHPRAEDFRRSLPGRWTDGYFQDSTLREGI